MTLDYSCTRFEFTRTENAVSDTILIYNKLTLKSTELEISQEGVCIHQIDDIQAECFNEYLHEVEKFEPVITLQTFEYDGDDFDDLYDYSQEYFPQLNIDIESTYGKITPLEFRANPLILAGKRVLVKYDDTYVTYDVLKANSKWLLLGPLGEVTSTAASFPNLSFDFIKIEANGFSMNKWTIYNEYDDTEPLEVTIHLIEP
jgi:hypothetical protein